MKVNIGEYPDNGETREVSIQIDDWDTHSLDHTLSLIICPALKKFKEKDSASPIINGDDVPEILKPPATFEQDISNDKFDEKMFQRWEYILEEMIWAFERISEDKEWEYEGQEKKDRQERIDNGLRLFAKYFEHLWV